MLQVGWVGVGSKWGCTWGTAVSAASAAAATACLPACVAPAFLQPMLALPALPPQALEFWCTVAEEESDRDGEPGSDGDSVNHQFIKAALPHLVPLLLEQLTKQEEGQVRGAALRLGGLGSGRGLCAGCGAGRAGCCMRYRCRRLAPGAACSIPPCAPALHTAAAGDGRRRVEREHGCGHVPGTVRQRGGRRHCPAGHALCHRQHPEDGRGRGVAPARGVLWLRLWLCWALAWP